MTTVLTETGWINEDGEFFPWTNKADVVDEGDDILVDVGVVANTLRGDDIITGTGFSDFFASGIVNNGTIDTGDGKDSITGTSSGGGIINEGTINLGRGIGHKLNL